MSRSRRDAQKRELWELVSGAGTSEPPGAPQLQVAAALKQLADSRQTPPSPQHVAWLLDVLDAPACSAASALHALALLARWARQQSMQPPQARQHELLRRVAASAQRLLGPTSGLLGGAGGPQLAAACVLVLGNVAAAATDLTVIEDAAEAVGTALLCGQLGAAEARATSDAAAAVGALLPSLLGKAEAAGWLLGAFLQWASHCTQGTGAAHAAVDCLAPTYPMLRSAATAAMARVGASTAIDGLLQPAYLVLKTAAAAAAAALPSSEPSAAAGMPPDEPAAAAAAHAAAAVLGLAGLAEGLLRSDSGDAKAARLAADAEASLVATCDMTAVSLAVAGTPLQHPARTGPASAAAYQGAGQTQAAQLLCDACSLASVRLAAALRRPAAAPSTARCQARSLLRSAVSLAPLCRAAAAQIPPAEASYQLRRLADGALAQQAGSLARALSQQLPSLDASTQLSVVQEVQAAALEAHHSYRRYALDTPTAWLSAVDAAAVRQLLDRLFLSCLVLLAAAWQAAPAHTQRAQRSQLAVAVLVALADLQFCRTASTQHAALLTAVLAEASGDVAGAAALAASLPCYAELVAECRARDGQPAWLVDGVTAAKVQLLLLALVPCVAALPQAALQQRLAPLAFLYLLHPHRPLAAAAHQLFCALLAAIEPAQQREPLAAFYVRRCLEGCPGATLQLLSEFGQGLGTILQSLPVGSPTALLCLQLVLERWRELAARGDPSSGDLAPLAAQQLLVIDHGLLGEALNAFDNALSQPVGIASGLSTAANPTGPASRAGDAGGAAAPAGLPGQQAHFAALERELRAAVHGSDDCLRKPVLARWLLEGHAAGSTTAAS